MIKKLAHFTLIAVVFCSTFAYTATDIAGANYLASKRIIKDWSGEPKNYRFDDYIARSEIMGMVLAMMNITRNTNCRGDFADVPKSNTDWVCRTIETAADHGLINPKPTGMKTRPYGNITRAEALGILMKAYPDDGGWAGYGYYWGYNFPIDGQKWGYESAYDFTATWQASVFYEYVQKILWDSNQLRVAPRPNSNATRREVFEFATKIDQKISPNQNKTEIDWKKYENKDLWFELEIPSYVTIDMEFNDRYNRLIVFKSDRENFEIRLKEEKNASLEQYYYLDFIPSGKWMLWGQEASIFEAINGYCDGPGCSEPFVAYATKYGYDFYNLVFNGDITLSEVEKYILSSFKFTK